MEINITLSDIRRKRPHLYAVLIDECPEAATLPDDITVLVCQAKSGDREIVAFVGDGSAYWGCPDWADSPDGEAAQIYREALSLFN